MLRLNLVLSLTAVLMVTSTRSAQAASTIIDHNSITQFNSLSNQAISKATALRLMLRRASVGGNISNGLNTLYSQDSRLNRTNWDFQDRGNPGWQAKVNDFVTQVAVQLNTRDVFSMKFCYIDPDADFASYRDHLTALQTQYPQKTIIWWTIPLETYNDPRKNAFNSSVRSWAQTHDIYLFDLADIESDGRTQTCGVVGGECLNSSYTSDGGHLNAAGEVLAAKGMWVLMSQIAEPQTTVAGDFNHDSLVDYLDWKMLVSQFNQVNLSFKLVSGTLVNLFDFNRMLTLIPD